MLFALFALFLAVSAQNPTDCMTFCSNYNATCMALAGNDIYTDMQACQDECAKYPVDANCPDGSDPVACASGNSYGCRRYHLNVAMNFTVSPGNDVTHCPHTSPLSAPTAVLTAAGTLTGTVCHTTFNALNATGQNGLVADFCNQVTSACSAWLNTLDMAKCVSYYFWIVGAMDVSHYPDGVNQKFPLVSVTGSGLPCRRYHAQVARQSTANAKEHCKHALFGADACGSPCDQLCTMGPAICPGSFDSNCMADCTSKVPAAVDPDYQVVTNRDIVCRLYHLAVASESPVLNAGHCSHASINSTSDTCATQGSGATTLSVSAFFIAALALITKFSS